MRKSLLSMLVILMLTLAACTPQATEEAMGDEAVMQESPTEEAMGSDDEMMDESADDDMMADEETMDEHSTSEGDNMDDDAMMDESMDDSSDDAMMELPAWFMADLVNVNTGESFKIEDYSGKVVLVETMAIWCSTCLSQQRQVQVLHGTLGDRDDFVSVALDIDINETGDALGQYAAQQGFDWVYAIAPAEVAREIGDLYGQQYLNPPSAPMFIIDRSGKAHTLPFGVKSADELQQAIEPFLSEGM